MIRHILSDGREVESVEGLVIPTTGPTAAVYKIITDYVNKRAETSPKNKETMTDATA